MKKSKKIILISCAVILAVIITASIISRITKSNKIKQVFDYYECTYYKTTSSKEKGYENDIYALIKYAPFESTGLVHSNQKLYETIIKAVSTRFNDVGFRIIDEEKNIIIRCKKNGNNVNYTINGDYNYFSNRQAQYNALNNDEKITNIEVISPLLNEIINNNWSKAGVKELLGTVDSNCNDYDYYFDEGYNVKTRNLKIFNIVFTNKYQGEVFKGISTGKDNNEITKILGEPITLDDDVNLIAYKTEKFYAFFHEGEISIYRTEEINEEENTKFANLVSTLLENNDYKKFLDNLTDLYPDYDEYVQEENSIKITYPIRGFSVILNQEKNAINIYKNYKGKITNDFSLSDVQNGQALPKNIYSMKQNLISLTEWNRINARSEGEIRPPKNFAKNFKLTYNGGIYRFYSVDKNNYDSEINDANVTSVFGLYDSTFVYGKYNDGIYLYNAENRQSTKIKSDTGNCIITSIHDNNIMYDDKEINLKQE